MTPVFDSNCYLFGWFDGDNLYDIDINWIAFYNDGHFFASSTIDWLGPHQNGSLLDKKGKPVAWLENTSAKNKKNI